MDSLLDNTGRELKTEPNGLPDKVTSRQLSNPMMELGDFNQDRQNDREQEEYDFFLQSGGRLQMKALKNSVDHASGPNKSERHEAEDSFEDSIDRYLDFKDNKDQPTQFKQVTAFRMNRTSSKQKLFL